MQKHKRHKKPRVAERRKGGRLRRKSEIGWKDRRHHESRFAAQLDSRE